MVGAEVAVVVAVVAVVAVTDLVIVDFDERRVVAVACCSRLVES
jgi:hypothetical protein